jgi:pimeloyl-ACP methyl ester carboxylesterase
VSIDMTERDPIHLGTGEPILLLHPFLCSQNVWQTVAEQVAATGRFEVFAPTMLAHHGGPRATTMNIDAATLADDIESRMDQLGWRTAHIVGNSLGGWVAFELQRRGRARSVTAIAPAGGWGRHSASKYETVLKFLLGGPALLIARLLGTRVLALPFGRQLATLAISGPADGPRRADLEALIEDATHCPAYFKLPVKTLRQPGLLHLGSIGIPTQLVLCEHDRVLPSPRGNRYFIEHLPAGTPVIRLSGLGHVPMLEAPGQIAELIVEFVEANTPQQEIPPTG